MITYETYFIASDYPTHVESLAYKYRSIQTTNCRDTSDDQSRYLQSCSCYDGFQPVSQLFNGMLPVPKCQLFNGMKPVS